MLYATISQLDYDHPMDHNIILSGSVFLTSGPGVTVKLSPLLNSRHTRSYLNPFNKLRSGDQLRRANVALLCGAVIEEIQPVIGSGLGHPAEGHGIYQINEALPSKQ